MNENADQITLSRDAALVLFELLSRAGPHDELRPIDSAERHVLWDVEAQLERLLPETFLPDYAAHLEAARARLRQPEPPRPTAPSLVAFVDVDDTLVRSVGSKRIPMTGVLDRVRSLHATGAALYCWSTAGAAYAHQTAIELGIAECFLDFLPKPGLLVDDQLPADWRHTRCLHPNEMLSMTVGEIEAVAGRTG
jgi:hypothetical protein